MEDKKLEGYFNKKELYLKNFGLGNFIESKSVNDKLILISLVTLVYLKSREKNPDILPIQILLQITKHKDYNSVFYDMLVNLSLLVEELSYGVTEADSCGLKNSTEIINKINSILTTWIPF
jgi:hypothetical protein